MLRSSFEFRCDDCGFVFTVCRHEIERDAKLIDLVKQLAALPVVDFVGQRALLAEIRTELRGHER